MIQQCNSLRYLGILAFLNASDDARFSSLDTQWDIHFTKLIFNLNYFDVFVAHTFSTFSSNLAHYQLS